MSLVVAAGFALLYFPAVPGGSILQEGIIAMIKDGGPAFPVPLNPGETITDSVSANGMTLRDYFAGQALTGWVSRLPQSSDTTADELAERSYRYADAMIAARDK